MSLRCEIELFSCLFLLCLNILILSQPVLGLGSKSKSLNPGFRVCRLRQFNRIYWRFDFLNICCFIDYLGRWNQWMLVLSWRRQGMLIEGPTPYPNCMLNISSIVTLLGVLDWWSSLCCYCKRWEDGKGGGWIIYVRVLKWEEGISIMFFTFFLVFALLVIVLSWLVHHDCCFCLFAPFLNSLSNVPLIELY